MEKLLKPLVIVLALSAGFFGFKHFDQAKKLKELQLYKTETDSALSSKKLLDDNLPLTRDSILQDPGTSTVVIYDIAVPNSTVNGAIVTIKKVGPDGRTTQCDMGTTTSEGVFISRNCNELIGEYIIDARIGRWVGQVRTNSTTPIRRIMLGL